jgi:2-octaprenyl-6-methoxyphenol hydroxylase
MSLADMRVLADLAAQAPDRLGDAQMLETYERRRHWDVKARATGIDVLNRASQMRARPLRDARALGLDAIYSLPPVRRTMMQLGLGARG